MSKSSKNIFKGEHRGFVWFVIIAFLALVAFLCLYPGSNFFSWMKAKSDIKEQRALIEQYQHKIDSLDAEINALRENKDTLEKYAREHYHYSAPGDDVYVIE